MFRLGVFILLIVSSLVVQAQTYTSSDPEYIRLVKEGEAALSEGDYEKCLSDYQAAFSIKHTSFLSTMRAATCAYALKDSQLLHYKLDTAFALNFDGAKSIFNQNPEFESWRPSALSTLVDQYWEAAIIDNGLDIALIKILSVVRELDQEQRKHMRTFSEEYGWESPQMDSLWQLQNRTDSICTIFITALIDADGYPGQSKVGSRLAGTAFLVIQHATPEVQRRYLPVLRKVADAGELSWSSLALLIDRVNLGEGKPQIYGSQIMRDTITNEFYFGQIKDPNNIDSIRASVGLRPLQQYADNWNFTWDPRKHKERFNKGDK